MGFLPAALRADAVAAGASGKETAHPPAPLPPFAPTASAALSRSTASFSEHTVPLPVDAMRSAPADAQGTASRHGVGFPTTPPLRKVVNKKEHLPCQGRWGKAKGEPYRNITINPPCHRGEGEPCGSVRATVDVVHGCKVATVSCRYGLREPRWARFLYALP